MPPTELVRAVHHSEDTMRGLADALLTGQRSLTDWYNGMEHEIRLVHSSAAAAAEEENPDPISQDVEAQLNYLDAFARDIESGSQPLDGTLPQRAGMYARAALGAHAEAERRQAQAAGATQERRVLDPDAQHCQECIDAAALSWQPIGALPRIGDCQCLTNCSCVFEFNTPSSADSGAAGFAWDEGKHPRGQPGNKGEFGSAASAGGESGDSGKHDDVTQTAEFREWFGKSKVVDADGKPRLLYRGSTGDSAAQHGGADSGNMVFLSTEKDLPARYASQYQGGKVRAFYVRAEHPVDISRDGYQLWKQYKAETNAPGYASGSTREGMAVAWTQEQDFRKWLDTKGVHYDGIYFAENDRSRSLAVKSLDQLWEVGDVSHLESKIHSRSADSGAAGFAFDESKHPRGFHGHFGSKGEFIEGRTVTPSKNWYRSKDPGMYMHTGFAGSRERNEPPSLGHIEVEEMGKGHGALSFMRALQGMWDDGWKEFRTTHLLPDGQKLFNRMEKLGLIKKTDRKHRSGQDIYTIEKEPWEFYKSVRGDSAAFASNQPRVPRGQAGGGRFTSAGGAALANVYATQQDLHDAIAAHRDRFEPALASTSSPEDYNATHAVATDHWRDTVDPHVHLMRAAIDIYRQTTGHTFYPQAELSSVEHAKRTRNIAYRDRHMRHVSFTWEEPSAQHDPSFSAAVSALAGAGASAEELGCAARELFARINFAATPASPWVPYTGPRGGRGWRNPNTGRIVYGARQPGLGRSRQTASGAPTPGTPKAQRADPAAVKAHIAQLLADPSQITSDAIREVKEQLLSMTVAQINTVKKDLGLKASGVKAELATKVAERALGGTAAPPAPPSPAPQPQLPSPPPVQPSSGLPAAQPGGEIEWSTGKPQPGTLNGIPFAPAPHHFWEKVQDKDVGEPPPARRIDRVGVMIQEPDGRIWIVKPTNEFGDRTYTMPGGGVEPGLTDQQNALKEVWEETGLQVEITGHLGDFEDSNNKNNGRLYIGRRIGGAPWDAKIEPHIIDRKTGKQAAESSEVVLTTPERAGKLLHRSDDLAQLMTVAPIPLDAPTMGRGSNPMKKFVDAIQPAAEAYKQAKQAAHQSPGSATLHAVQELRGFNKRPQVVAKNDMDALISQGGHIEVLRGLSADALPHVSATRVAQKLADDFRYGDHFPGYGIFGAGTYTDSTRGHSNIASSYAGGYRGGSGSGSAMLRMAIPKTAKIVKFSELERQVPRAPGMFTDRGSTSGPTDNWRGVQAALAGYDAIHMDEPGYGKDFYVVLNRGVVTVQKEDATGHVIR